MTKTKSNSVRELFLLPFDHRTSFEKDLFGISGRPPTLREVEKSGQDEFDFEYGTAFGEHILKVNPTYVKALVRYNPEDHSALNARQIPRLQLLSQFCRERSLRFMFELLVPATSGQLKGVEGNLQDYDRQLRPKLMIQSIRELQSHGIEPNIWKVEGLHVAADYVQLVDQARSQGRTHVTMILLGRGADRKTVSNWLTLAAQVPGFRGFAIGRTIWEESLKQVFLGRISPIEASGKIANEYRFYCDLWTRSAEKRSRLAS